MQYELIIYRNLKQLSKGNVPLDTDVDLTLTIGGAVATNASVGDIMMVKANLTTAGKTSKLKLQ